LFVPGEADLDERPAPLGNEPDAAAAAAAAASERLRSQCQQLIRALTHNAQELASNASALAHGRIGFEETRALWRKFPDDRVGGKTVAQTLLEQALADTPTHCSDYVLAVGGQINLASEEGADPCVLDSTVLLSDRDGLPFAAPRPLPAHPAQSGMPYPVWAQQQKFGKPVIHLFARIPASGLMRQWQSSGLQWAACGSAALRIVDAGSGTPGTLAKLAAGLAFSAPQPLRYRKKNAWVSVAEALVSLRPGPKDNTVGTEAGSPTLRCVVMRIVDADSGKPLAHSYVLASTGIQATAQQMAQWPAWRTAAEPCFKLLKQGMLQLGDVGTPDDAAMQKRLLIAGQASTTVFRLQRARDAWAETARKALAQLAGRSVRPDRSVPGPALFEGLGKLFVLLDALETDAAAVAPQSLMAPAPG
jgi:flagellar biosynthesis protein FlhF